VKERTGHRVLFEDELGGRLRAPRHEVMVDVLCPSCKTRILNVWVPAVSAVAVTRCDMDADFKRDHEISANELLGGRPEHEPFSLVDG
jgi:hypothetical protein